MYTLPSTSFKRGFYSQTGNFQFSSTVQLTSNYNSLEFGLSGSGQSNINFLLSNGKVYDASGRFVEVYNANDIVNISGNCTQYSYDYFINGYPLAYGLSKSFGIYDHFYFKNNGVTGGYDFIINGQQPKLTVNNIVCNSGDSSVVGSIVNMDLPVNIYSGVLTNYTSGSLTGQSSFGFSGVPTGILTYSENFAIYPLPNSTGINSGTLRLYTNGGNFDYPFQINISGTQTSNFSIDLSGPNTISNGRHNNYTSSIIADYYIPISVSLQYISGSGEWYTNIPISSGYFGNIISGITGSGIATQYVTGFGSGFGGFYNLMATGLASGIISGLAYATGDFIWNYPNIIYTGLGYTSYIQNYTGYYTGVYSSNYTGLFSGLGTGITPAPYTGYYSNNYTGNYIDVGLTTNYSGQYTGFYTGMYTGMTTGISTGQSGYYYGEYTGQYTGCYTGSYIETFISNGTGLISSNLISGTILNGSGYYNYNGNIYSNYSPVYSVGNTYLPTGTPLTLFKNSTGKLVNTFTGVNSGISIPVSGNIYGSGNVLNYTKNLTGIWDLTTGAIGQSVDFRQSGWYSGGKYINPPMYSPSFLNGILLSNITYTNNYDTNHDIVLLTISGYGTNSSVNITITGNI